MAEHRWEAWDTAQEWKGAGLCEHRGRAISVGPHGRACNRRSGSRLCAGDVTCGRKKAPVSRGPGVLLYAIASTGTGHARGLRLSG
jgi:hypothetical protein